MPTNYIRRCNTPQESKKVIAAMTTLGATDLRLTASGYWRCTKDGEIAYLDHHGVKKMRGERILVRVSTNDDTGYPCWEDCWVTPGTSEFSTARLYVEGTLP
jgi:hypothetical protein